MRVTQAAANQISYTVKSASFAVDLSEFPIKQAIARGDLTAHWSGAKRLILHDDLVDWVKNLPVDKP